MPLVESAGQDLQFNATAALITVDTLFEAFCAQKDFVKIVVLFGLLYWWGFLGINKYF